MGKNKKRKISSSDDGATNHSDDNYKDAANRKSNPLYREQRLFLSSLTPQERESYFSPQAITPERRAELWMEQADIGEALVNKYAWATPTTDCLKIFREFSPIIELGSGSNAYWTKYMKQATGIDVVAYDMNVREGGKIRSGSNKKGKTKKSSAKDASAVIVQKGGPEVLSLPELQKHTLFLCYPDEEDDPTPEESADPIEQEENNRSLSFGWQCLAQYTGTYVIHVGELAVLGDATLNMEQSPWGRSSSSEFQQRLASEYHCIAKIPLQNWLHVRDSISVWKRSEICQMAFVGDEDDEDDEEEIIEYRHIPPKEMLPTSVIAPCMQHILGPSLPTKTEISTTKPKPVDTQEQKMKNTPKSDESGEDKKVLPMNVETKADQETENEPDSKKTKGWRRRERQKQKKMQSMQRFPSQSGEEKAKDQDQSKQDKEKSKKDKTARSEYFRIHGKLPT